MSTSYKHYYGSGYNRCVGYEYNCYARNIDPVAKSDYFSGHEDQPIVIAVANLLSNDSDKNHDKLMLTSVQGALNGAVSLDNGNVTFTPMANYNGPASFTYTVSDGKGGATSATVNLSISPVNDRPDAVDDHLVAITSGNVTIDPSTLLANDKDVDGDKLIITSVQSATHGTVALVNEQVVFTPDAGYSGPATFTYTVTDGKGGCGHLSSDTATVCLTIPNVNVAPDAVNDAMDGNEDTPFVFLAYTLLDNDTDANHDHLTVVSVQGAVNGAVVMVNGEATFTPDANYFGPASFTYTISDGNGGLDTATVNLNICAVNDAPTAVNDGVFNTLQDTKISFIPASLLANDSDVDADVVQGVSIQDAVNGKVEYINGIVVFTPNAGFAGAASFTYTISDGKGGYDTATVSINVQGNTPPHGVNDAMDGSEDTPFVFLASTLLDNDTDVNHDHLTVVSVQGAVNGAVVMINGEVTFTPNANYFGPASFTYTISDGNGGLDTATVNLNICAVNDAPTAINDGVFVGNENSPLVLDFAALLANDTDIDGDTLTISHVQAGEHGTVAIVDGQVVFTPIANYNGPASFTYTVADGNGGFSTATVNLNIDAAIHTVEVAPASVNVSEEGLVGGLQDSIGNPDTTNASIAEGNLQISNAAGNLTITLLQPSEVLTSGGATVTWLGSGTEQLTAMAGAKEVATVTVDNSGHYAFNLLAPLDHSGVNIQDVKSINIGVSVADSFASATTSLSVNFEDDAPVALNRSDSFAMIDTNLLITLDTSNSMNDLSGINAETRLQSAIKSIERLMDSYDDFGDIRVRLITFSNNAETQGSEWVTVSAAKTILDSILTTGGTTNYDGAIANAMTAFNDPGKISDAQNISYFFSDGNPNRGDGNNAILSNIGSSVGPDNGIQLAEEAVWKSFLNDNQIKSYAIGMGAGLTDVSYLNPIAYDGQARQEINGVIVTEMGQLDGVLASTVNVFPGQLLSGGLLAAHAGVGADGGYVKSITVEGVTYAFDPITDTVSNATNGLMHFDTATRQLTVTLSSGGHFMVDMDQGSYQYQAPAVLSNAIVEHFDYVIIDKDGDQASATVTFDVDKANVTIGTTGADTLIGVAGPDVMLGREGNDILIGGGGKDELLGGDGDDTLVGGTGLDTMSGGLGADTFVWALADAGVKGNPAIDIVTDFDMASKASGGDVLDLRDLLVGENHTSGIGNLASYLHFEKAGADTVVHISATGEFAAGFNAANEVQNITLLNVDLIAGLANDQAVIQDLLTKNKLTVD
ncbi:cadherin-like domain-containing protein [Methylotenera sp.]|uniref:cadherin-like domain-containing protein n=1 Tax=Methylotenera sp. TaxID=2051956 RepID=UPI002488F43A|nr:cadherin-like domain-containing protein [Methylotenera sp.]MDI1298136.1 cadherin-like domain-containing protein [Methylotenera sp.]